MSGKKKKPVSRMVDRHPDIFQPETKTPEEELAEKLAPLEGLVDEVAVVVEKDETPAEVVEKVEELEPIEKLMRHDAPPEPEKPIYVISTPGALNVRARPDVTSPILYAVPKGHRFLFLKSVTDGVNSWSHIRSLEHLTGEGYVMSVYVKFEKEE